MMIDDTSLIFNIVGIIKYAVHLCAQLKISRRSLRCYRCVTYLLLLFYSNIDWQKGRDGPALELEANAWDAKALWGYLRFDFGNIFGRNSKYRKQPLLLNWNERCKEVKISHTWLATAQQENCIKCYKRNVCQVQRSCYVSFVLHGTAGLLKIRLQYIHERWRRFGVARNMGIQNKVARCIYVQYA